MSKFPSYIGKGLMVVGVGAFLISMFNDSHDSLLYATYAYMVAAIALAIVAAIAGLIIHPKSVKSTGIGLGTIVLLAIISYSMSGDEVLEKYGNITPLVSKLSDMGLYMMFILLIGAIAAVVFSGIKKMIS
jgi:disulfide bond formation protein DsbB